MREPRFATWMLRHFTTVDEFVAGDLLEQYRRGGRSPLWYWWQVLSAIGHDVIRDIRLHPVRVPLAIAIGLMVQWRANPIGNSILSSLLNLPEWLFATGLWRAPLANGFAFPHALLAWPVLAAVKALLYASTGWIVMRTASASHPSIALVYAGCVAVADVIAFIHYVGRYPTAQLTIDGLILYPAAALIGGLLASRSRAFVPRR